MPPLALPGWAVKCRIKRKSQNRNSQFDAMKTMMLGGFAEQFGKKILGSQTRFSRLRAIFSTSNRK